MVRRSFHRSGWTSPCFPQICQVTLRENFSKSCPFFTSCHALGCHNSDIFSVNTQSCVEQTRKVAKCLHEVPTSFSGCSYLVLQPNYDAFGNPGYAPILLSIWQNRSLRSAHMFDTVCFLLCLKLLVPVPLSKPFAHLKLFSQSSRRPPNRLSFVQPQHWAILAWEQAKASSLYCGIQSFVLINLIRHIFLFIRFLDPSWWWWSFAGESLFHGMLLAISHLSGEC